MGENIYKWYELIYIYIQNNLWPQSNSLEVTYLEWEVTEFFPCGHTTDHEKCVVYHLKHIKLRWYFK